MIQNQYELDFKVGDKIEFELMFKSKSKANTVILPYELIGQFKSDEQKINSFDIFNEEEYIKGRKYFKIFSKSCKEIHKSIIERERKQLTKQREEEKDQPEVCFIDEAFNLLLERENDLKLQCETKKNFKKSSTSPEKCNMVEDLEKLTIENVIIPIENVKF